MSTLIVDQLTDTLVVTQAIRVNRSVSIAHIRPWVYLQGTLADGSFRCRVYQGANLLATSLIPVADINAAKSQPYAHGYLRFDFDSLILHRQEGESDTEYIFEFGMVGHTLDNNNYLGIVREWDLKSSILYGAGLDTNNQAVNDQVEPYGYQIFEYRG
jgi:hypothetical protein